MITTFLSRDNDHWFGNVQERVSGCEYSHGGLHRRTLRVDETFEHRIRGGTYQWQDYEVGNYRLAEWRLRKLSDTQMRGVYYLIKKSWEGKLYGAGQIFGMLSHYLWMRAGVRRKIGQHYRGICTRLLWDVSDLAMSEYQEHLRSGPYKDPAAFGSLECMALYASAPELYERVR